MLRRTTVAVLEQQNSSTELSFPISNLGALVSPVGDHGVLGRLPTVKPMSVSDIIPLAPTILVLISSIYKYRNFGSDGMVLGCLRVYVSGC